MAVEKRKDGGVVTADQLKRIEEALDNLQRVEKKTNGMQLWLWIINGIVLPALAFCLFNVISITSNRYTIQDSRVHSSVHAALMERVAKIEAKLSGLPPNQIEENRIDIRKLQEQQRGK